MTEQEAVICNAILIKNVWEIRSRDQFTKHQNEASRKEKSALERINQDWQSRMGDKYKPRRKPQTAPPPDGPPPPPRIRISVSKTRSPEISDRPSGFGVGRRPMDKKATQATDKLALLSLLKSSAPSGSMWSSSWKFSKAPGEGSQRPEGSEWGTSWKCLNFQPQLEGKAWNEQEYAHAEWGHHAELKEGKWWERTHSHSDTLESLERQLSEEWETSWKYKKSHGKKHEHTSHGTKNGPLAQLRHLETSHHRNEEKHASEWGDSWKSTKPSENGNVGFEENMAQNGEHHHDNHDHSDSKWGVSWQYLNHHAFSKGAKKSSKASGWNDAWKISKPVEYSGEMSSGGASWEAMGYEPLDPYIHGELVPVHRADQHRCWRALHDEGKIPLAEWGKSWEGAKNSTILAHVKPRKKVEPKGQEKKVEEKKEEESEHNGLPKRLKPKDRMAIREKQMKPLGEGELSYEWNESWKSPRSQSKKDHLAKHDVASRNKPMIIQPYFKVKCLPDWKESWKCAKSRPKFGSPSITEWKNSSLLGHELRIGRHQGLKSDRYEVFALPSRGVTPNMLRSFTNMEKHKFSSEWKDSVHPLKHEIRREVHRTRANKSKPFRDPEKGETPVSEWKNAWKFTNVTLAQDNNLWDQGWSFTENIRQDRWATERAHQDQGVPHNGPTGSRGWGDSWRSTRGQHRVEGATGGQQPAHHHHQHHSGSPLSRGWENSWRVTSIHHGHHLRNRPAMTAWWESWEFSGLHWYERPPKEKFIQRSMAITHKKPLHHVPREGKISQSFNPDVFKQRVPPCEWMESWKMATLQRHHKRHPLKSRSSSSAPIHEVMSNPDWSKTWKFINLLSHQEQALWDNGWETFEVEKKPPAPEYVPMHETTQSSCNSEWSTSWRICGPQPLEWDDTPKAFHRRDRVLFSRKQGNTHHFSHLHKHSLPERLWGKSWRFMKLESSLSPMTQMSESTSSHSHSSNDKSRKTHKAKKNLYNDIEKSKPQPKRWADATKLAKTQPRARKGPLKGAKAKVEEENLLFDWLNSWKMSNDSVSSKEDTVSWAQWVNSWKFLLGSYPQERKGSAGKSF